ncbi:unnamed protein product [Penicillium nalgiovense]|uniref:GPI anchored serine-rich protein n=1 Tax=Penicillium nalgiovense TaxID=60175 RepID=A0A1V6XHI3_PENNA|nr:hypothetical protein PENNAL_c0078G07973 [Penicillium nalgiovense]CAG7950685.1 unnamed protein product [Penicillium nalgiovense]CAG7977473.1 unnamed protein product [Penicillium nalgiovense]CAG7979518.1 unnamed protein product [Penicillium nalgiovense]CAG7979620.1 unnamed protein product [Penicillium nalgiovense]
MRFTTATIAFFAGLAIAAPGADQTVYETDEVTITSCAPTVTDCPGNSGAGVEPTGSTTPSSVPAAVTSPAGEASETPVPSAETETPAWSSVPTWAPSVPAPSAPSSVPSAPAPAPPAGTPVVSSSVIAVTTCVPTVIYSTVPVSATTPAGGNVPHGPTGGVPHVPSSSKGVATGTASVSPATSSPAFNGGATLSGSLGFAGAAAVAAFFL